MKLSQSDLESIKKNKEILAQVNAARADTADERAAKAHSIETKKAPTPSTKNQSAPATPAVGENLRKYVQSIMPKPESELTNAIKTLSTDEKAIAPMLGWISSVKESSKQQEREKEEKKARGAREILGLDLLQKGAFYDIGKHFEDGYQFGDVSKTAADAGLDVGKAILGTAGDLGIEVGRGFGNFSEGIADAVLNGGADVADLFGNEALAENWRYSADKEVINDTLDPYDEAVEEWSILGDTSDAAASGVGQMLAMLGVGKLVSAAAGAAGASATTAPKIVNGVTKTLMGLSSYGNGVGEARRSGATNDEARVFGLLSAAAEVIGDSMFSNMGKYAKAMGVDIGKFDLDDVIAKKVGSLIRSPAWKNAVQGAIKGFGNGAEEGVTGFLQGVAKKVTYMKDKDLWNIIAKENLFEQLMVGWLTGDAVQSIEVYNANKAGRDLITGLNWTDTQNSSVEGNTQKNAISEEMENNTTQFQTIDQNKPLRAPTYEELTQKPDLKVINVGRNTEGKSYSELKADVLQKAHQEGWLDAPHTNKDTGLPIFVTEQSFSHAFSNLTKDFGTDTILTMGNIPDIISEAVLTHVDLPKNPRKAESRVFTFFAAIEGENGTEPVKLTVKEYSGRNHADWPKRILNYFLKNNSETTYNTLYDAKALEVLSVEKTKKELGASASVAARETRAGAKGTPNSTIRIADLMGLVNSDAQKYIPSIIENQESPSSNSKDGVTDGAKESGKAGITARPEGLSEVGYPSTASAEPTSLFDTSTREPSQIVNPQAPGNAQPSPSTGTPKQSLADYVASIMPKPPQTAQVDTVTQTDYDNGNQNEPAPDSMDIIDSVLKKQAGIKYNGGRVIQLAKNEYAAVTSRISTNYYYANTKHDGVQFVDRSTDGNNARMYMYLYRDHGFGTYEIIGRIDYSQHDELIRYLREAITYGNQTDRTPKGVSEYIGRLRSINERTDRSRRSDQHGRQNPRNEQSAPFRSGQWQGDNRRSARTDPDGYDDRGPSVRQTNYNNTTTSQGGNSDANTQPQRGSVYPGRIRRNTQADPKGKATGSGSYGGTYAPVGGQSGTLSEGDRANVHVKDSEGRTLNQEQASRLQNTSVVDENGNPIAVYHSTDDLDFVTFEKGDTGFHFGTAEQASRLADQRKYANGRIFRVYLDIKNPYHSSRDIMGWNPPHTALLLWSDGILTEQDYKEILGLWKQDDGYNSKSAVRLREMIEGKGYDGISYPNGFEGEGLSYMAFHDNQIIRSEITPFPDTSHQASPNPNAKDSPSFSPTPSVGTADGGGYGQNTVGSAESRFQHEVKRSKLYTNTYANATDPSVRQVGEQAKALDPNIDQYDVITEKESLHNAALRTSSPEAIDAEYADLVAKAHWSGEDLDTAKIVLEKLLDQGDTDRFQQLARKQRAVMTAGGQLIQAAAKYTRTNAASTMAEQLDSLTTQTVSSSHFQKQGFEAWKKDVSATAFDLIKQVGSVKTGDTETMKQIIRSIARFRKTTAWFGASSNLTKAAERTLNTLDFDTAKEIALRQISQIPGDFRKRSKGEVLKSIRIQNMLSSLLTIERNLGGNSAIGIMDGLSDSTVGLGLDLLISKVTGQRTVGFDIKYAPEYIKAAKEGAAKAALCAELDISMDTDTKYEGNATRTHSPQGGPVTRFLSAYEKYLKYALEVTDKFYESGTYTAVEKSLQELGEKSNLQPEQIAAVSRKTANRRTFKDDGALATAAKGLRNAANSLTKSVSPDFGVGDMVLPFAGVGSNVAQTGIDYTAGTVKGAAEIFKLMADVKNGKEIDPDRQRKAVTDAARGVTGVGLISLFFALAAKGIIRAGDDEDKDRRALEQSSGLSGAQINIDAALRGLQGKSTQWQKDDVVFTVDFLEPFNTQMYLGYMLSQEDDLNLLNVTGATVQSIMASLMDSPMMQGLNEAVDLAENLTQAEGLGEKAIAIGEYAGQTATSFIPGYVRQFAHTVDPIYRDTTGDNAADAAWNQAKAQIPWLSKTLPAKYGADGQPLRRYDASDKGTLLGVRNNLLNPVTVTILDDPKLANALGDLSDRTGNVTIYPEKQAPKSFTVDGQTVLVSGKEMTETYQRTYMGHINDIYGTLLNDPVFDGLPDALKVKSLEYAKQYATEKAKASVSNFSLTSWVASAGDAPATAILDKVAVASTTDALTNVVNAWKNATKHTDADTAALDATWAIFQSMDKEHQAAIINEQSGRVGAYLTARQAGMSTSVFVDLYKQYWSLDNNITLSDSARAKNWAVDLDHAVEDGRITQKQRNALWDSLGYWSSYRQKTEKYDGLVDSGLSATQSSDLLSTIAAIVPKPGNAQVSNAQTYEAIINFPGLSQKQEDAALRLYMDDDTTEKKYDQVLDMGLTAQDYLDAYNAIQEESGDGKKKRVIAQFQSEFNMTHAQAKALYEIYVKPSK